MLTFIIIWRKVRVVRVLYANYIVFSIYVVRDTGKDTEYISY